MNHAVVHWQFARASDLNALLQIEQQAYSHPWSMLNFQESLASGYRIQTLWTADPSRAESAQLIGYSVVMRGVDEAHLLNITIAPSHQRQGLAPRMLCELCDWASTQALHWLWLEVRASNARALAVYERFGLNRVGQRKGYYPASRSAREDAVVMSASIAQLLENCSMTEATA